MLELSRITRRVITARMRYQRLRNHELELMRSIIDDENEHAGTQLKEIDLQIGALRNMLDEGGVTGIGDKGCRFDPSVFHDDSEPWRESSSSDVGSILFVYGSASDSGSVAGCGDDE